MLLELCQGGELFSRLLEETTLSEDTTRFYTGCIILALEALHEKDNIYRDLKPENILLDTLGYVKIGDFGFAKKVKDRTFTRCGTPEYVSPEMLGRAGHNKATDYWSLGIFVYECLHGTTPFAAKNYLSTYKKIAAYSKQGKMKWHIDLTQDVQSLMQGLLMAKPDKRFGTTEGGIKVLKDHAWFNKNGFSWEALYNKTIAAPFVPVVTGSTDLQYFNPEDGVHVRPFCSPPRPESSACAADTRPRP
jgi:protein kinase A